MVIIHHQRKCDTHKHTQANLHTIYSITSIQQVVSVSELCGKDGEQVVCGRVEELRHA